MWIKAGIWCVLFLLGFAITAAWRGPSDFSFALFPIPIAIAVVRKQFQFVHALLGCAAASAAAGIAFRVGIFDGADVLLSREGLLLAGLTVTYYVFVAFVGVPLGWGILARWSYGRIVTVVSATVFAVVLPVNVVGWETINASCLELLDAFEKQLLVRGEASPDDSIDQQLAQINWLREHNVDLFFGLICFGTVLVMTCLTLSATSAGLRRWFGEPGPSGSFAEMRPPDWLAWVVIVVALSYFADRQWPEFGLRTYVWNTALGLGVIYWLNGLSVVAYATNMLQPNFIVFTLFVFVIFVSGFVPMFCAVGLFDTWADFRTRVRAFATAWKERADKS